MTYITFNSHKYAYRFVHMLTISNEKKIPAHLYLSREFFPFRPAFPTLQCLI